MTKDRLVEIVENRIKTEFRKYGKHEEMNWELIAAKKIVGTFLYILKRGPIETGPREEGDDASEDNIG